MHTATTFETTCPACAGDILVTYEVSPPEPHIGIMRPIIGVLNITVQMDAPDACQCPLPGGGDICSIVPDCYENLGA